MRGDREVVVVLQAPAAAAAPARRAEAAEAVLRVRRLLQFPQLCLRAGRLARPVAAGLPGHRDAEEGGQADLDAGGGVPAGDLAGDGQRPVDRDREAGAAAAFADRRAVGRGVHADDLALGVCQRAARVTGDDRRVGLQHAVQVLGGARALVAGLDRLIQAGDVAGHDGRLPSWPSALPRATTASPTWTCAELPSGTGVRLVAPTSRSSATSSVASVPSTVTR